MAQYAHTEILNNAKLNAERYIIVLNKSGLDRKTKIDLLNKFIQKMLENNFKYCMEENIEFNRNEIIDVWSEINQELQKKLT